MTNPLVATFTEALGDRDDILLTLLLDSSGSIGSEYETLRQLASVITTKLPGVLTQVIQFATATRIECPFTNDEKVLKKAIEKMVHLQTQTNMYDAFTKTFETYQLMMTQSSKPVIFFVTDGDYSGKNPQSPIQKLLTMEPKATIIGIGVGSGTSDTKIAKLLPGQPHFHCGNMTQLVQIIEQLTVVPKQDPCVRLVAYPGGTRLQKSTEPLMLRFLVSPDYPLDTVPKGTEVVFLANNFFFRESHKLTKDATKEVPYEFVVSLEVKPAGKQYGALPSGIQTEVKIPGRPRIIKGCVTMKLGWFAGDFIIDDNPEQFYNILIWGGMGSGKSCLINGIATCLSEDEKVKTPLKSFRTDKHCTMQYSGNSTQHLIPSSTRSPLEQLIRQQVKVQIWDPWGVTPDEYKRLGLHHFLEGRVPNKQQQTDNLSQLKPSDSSIIHAVIFVIPATSAADSTMMDKLHEHIEAALQKDLQPLLVVNYRDCFETEEELLANEEFIFQKSMLSRKDIFSMDNYVNEKFRNISKDLSYFNLLREAFERAAAFVDKMDLWNAGEPLRKPVAKRPSYSMDSPTCQTPQCPYYLKPVTTKRCVDCGKVPQSPVDQPVCLNRECKEYLKAVKTKRCGECGELPGMNCDDSTPKCQTEGCANYLKAITTKRCGECGELPSTKEKAAPVCLTEGCDNYSKKVTTTRCGECGQLPQIPSESTGPTCPKKNCKKFGTTLETPFCPLCGTKGVASSAGGESNTRRCLNSKCNAFKKEVTTPCCVQCGKKPGCRGDNTPKKAGRVCPEQSCSNYKKPVAKAFACCPYCGARV